MWVDTHAHVQLAAIEANVLLERAREVDWVVVPGVDVSSSMAALALSHQHPDRVLAAVGLHPHDAQEWRSQATELEQLATSADAVGETGLDFYRSLSPRDDQLESFRAQAELAIALDKPLIVHCRDAFGEVYDVLESLGCGRRTILHCWTGGSRWTKRFLELDATFSFAGPITYPGGDGVRAAASVVPPGRATVETDTPFLTPPPHRDQPNEPANVEQVGAALAEVWHLGVPEVAKFTSRTAAEFFRR